MYFKEAKRYEQNTRNHISSSPEDTQEDSQGSTSLQESKEVQP
jgi:hypothetical protein|nr:MAG TPA: hypothetical protein [Caudoviricetes sp.]